ncbi:MAG TPA: hypothetical protein VFH47_04155 [Candidatus Thermoplasmatota archaeon]|nr:hypothetical protein [Candidatus Thermoplasmatota archaeon]
MTPAQQQAAPRQEERDYLVIYEEPDESGLPVDDDALVLDIEHGRSATLGEIDVQQKLDLELRNDNNRIGTVGFALTILGALTGLGLMVAFATTFPESYYNANRSINAEIIPPMVGGSLVAFVLLSLGTIATIYGRRIQARGNLTAVRIVEKARTPRAGFQE